MTFYDSLNPNRVQLLDSAAGNAAAQIADETTALDLAELNQQGRNLRLAALSIALVLSDSIVSNDLGEDELPSDRFATLMAGFSGSEDGEGDIEIDEPTLEIISANIQDAFASLGVTDSSLIDAAFGDDVEAADAAIEAIAEIVEANIPTEESELDEFVQAFVYGDSIAEINEDGMLLDSAVGKTTVKSGKLGKVIYKSMKAVRNGKITVVNKRVAGKVRLSPKQKAALNKARVKAFSSSAMSKRLRSVKKGKRAGLY